MQTVKIAAFIFFSSVFAHARGIEQVHAEFSLGTRPLVNFPALSDYLVLERKIVSAEHDVPRYEELTVLSLAKGTLGREIATTSKLKLLSTFANQEWVPSVLSGKLPNELAFTIDLQIQVQSHVMMPPGSFATYYCGSNEQPGVLEDPQVKRICLKSAQSVEVN